MLHDAEPDINFKFHSTYFSYSRTQLELQYDNMFAITWQLKVEGFSQFAQHIHRKWSKNELRSVPAVKQLWPLILRSCSHSLLHMQHCSVPFDIRGGTVFVLHVYCMIKKVIFSAGRLCSCTNTALQKREDKTTVGAEPDSEPASHSLLQEPPPPPLTASVCQDIAGCNKPFSHQGALSGAVFTLVQTVNSHLFKSILQIDMTGIIKDTKRYINLLLPWGKHPNNVIMIMSYLFRRMCSCLSLILCRSMW